MEGISRLVGLRVSSVQIQQWECVQYLDVCLRYRRQVFVPTRSEFMRGRSLPLFFGKIAPLLQLDDIRIAVADMTSGVTK